MDVIFEQALNFQLKHALSIVGFRDTTVGEVDEDKIFTNQKIIDEFVTIIQDQNTFKPIISDITRLIETNRIVPVHVKFGLLKKITYLFFKNKKKFAQSNSALAFFDFASRKIFVLVENIENFHYWKKQEALSLVLLHELQHMTALLFPNSFIKIHSKSLALYYKRFFKLYFDKNITIQDSYNIVIWLHNRTETMTGRTSLDSETMNQYIKILWKTLKPYYKESINLKRDVTDYFRVLSIYLNMPSMYSESLHTGNKQVLRMFFSLKNSYKALNILKNDSLCIQEILFPSEIISIESEYNTQERHFKLVKAIK